MVGARPCEGARGGRKARWSGTRARGASSAAGTAVVAVARAGEGGMRTPRWSASQAWGASPATGTAAGRRWRDQVIGHASRWRPGRTATGERQDDERTDRPIRPATPRSEVGARDAIGYTVRRTRPVICPWMIAITAVFGAVAP